MTASNPLAIAASWAMFAVFLLLAWAYQRYPGMMWLCLGGAAGFFAMAIYLTTRPEPKKEA